MSFRLILSGLFVMLALVVATGPTVAFAQDCASRINQVQAMADGMTRSARRTSANHQLQNARAELAAGDERRCLLFVRSAESSLEQWRRDGRD